MVLVVLKIIYKLNCGFYYITLIFQPKKNLKKKIEEGEKLTLKLIRKISSDNCLFCKENLHKKNN